ncbi:ribonuclease HII [Candidatus Pacearchaeota archaeon]|nr:ribonuclease HII [Candidatus Pacearchaeota archaeon]
MLTLGIDDAGRGPVVGPMVLAGVLIDDEIAKTFKELGVKDSKQLTAKKRDFLAEIVRNKAISFEIVVIFPNDIDGENSRGVNLNDVEAIACARIINRTNKGFGKIKVILDCPSKNIESWKAFLTTKIENKRTLEISCEHKADVNHIAVSAASVIAKDIREKEMAKLKEKYGKEIGSGYSSDPVTIKFLHENFRKYHDEGIFRKSWATWRDAAGKVAQKKLEF